MTFFHAIQKVGIDLYIVVCFTETNIYLVEKESIKHDGENVL